MTPYGLGGKCYWSVVLPNFEMLPRSCGNTFLDTRWWPVSPAKQWITRKWNRISKHCKQFFVTNQCYQFASIKGGFSEHTYFLQEAAYKKLSPPIAKIKKPQYWPKVLVSCYRHKNACTKIRDPGPTLSKPDSKWHKAGGCNFQHNSWNVGMHESFFFFFLYIFI